MSFKVSRRLNGNHNSNSNNQNNNNNRQPANNNSNNSNSIYGRARSQDYGLDHMPSNSYNVPHLLYDENSETDTLTPRTGCFHFLKSSSSAVTMSPGNSGRLGGSLGNSPAVGRKKLSLDSQFVPTTTTTLLTPTTPTTTMIISPQQLQQPTERCGDNNTYDRAFYRDVVKKILASSERVNSKSSGDLTMYNSSTRLTEQRVDYDDYEDAEEAKESHFQRNASGSQFPRHCFFREQPNSVQREKEKEEEHEEESEEETEKDREQRNINSHCSTEHLSSSAIDTSTTLSPTLESNQMRATSRKSSVTFQMNSTASESATSGASAAAATPLQSPSLSQHQRFQTFNNSISFATNYSSSDNDNDNDNADDDCHRSDDNGDDSDRLDVDDTQNGSLIHENSIFHTRRMLDVQPHPDVIKMKQSLIEEQQRQDKKKKPRLKYMTKSKSVEAATNEVVQQLQQQQQQPQQQQQHSTSGIKFRSLMNLFTRGSKKKYTKLSDNQLGNAGSGSRSGSIAEFAAIDPYETELAMATATTATTTTSGRSSKRKSKKPQTQSCEQLERV